MKRICKKMIVTLLTVVLVFNFIMNPFCFAGSDAVRDLIADILGTFVGIMTWPIRFLALGVGYAIDMIAAAIAYVDGTVDSVDKQLIITPFEIVFNETAITNVDFFDFTSVGSDTVVYKIRTAVAGWYYFMRLIAIAILLVILVYVGIRMAISTVADDKAKYKKMLVDWLASLALVFVLQYIMVFMIEISNAVVSAMAASRPEGLEDALNGIAIEALGLSIESFGSTVVFFLFVFQTFSILFSYINRMIRVAFLIVISPLITITYSIDKMGDGKAQALNEWLKEFVTSILIQPFHCVIYMVFVSTAMDLLANETDTGTSRLASTVVAILCMMFINDAEIIVRKIFSLNGDDNASSIAKGAAVAGAALHKSKDIGKAARKGINMAKEAKPLQTGKKMFNEARSAISATGKTIADKVSGKGGPGFTENFNASQAKIQQKSEEREERKAQKKFKKYGTRTVETVKDGDKVKKITNNDRLEEKKKKLAERPENKNLTKEQIERKAMAEMVRENKSNGNLSSRPIRGVRRAATGAKRAARNFANTTTGKVIGQTFQSAVGFAAGSMALGTEDMFTAIATGGAVKNAVTEFMSSSNAVIANEAAEFKEVAKVSSVTEIENLHADLKSGKLEKDRDDKEDELEKALRQMKDENGKAFDDKDIDALIATMKGELRKQPNADLEQVIQDSLGNALSSCEQEVQKAIEGAMNEFKKVTAQVGLAQAIDKGTSYGASVSTLAQETIDRSSVRPIINDDRSIEDLYKANVAMRNIPQNETTIKEIVKKVEVSGGNVKSYINQMKNEMANLAYEDLEPEDRARFKSNYEHNIGLLEGYQREHTESE